MSKKLRCSECVFFNHSDDPLKLGECRKKPPVFILEDRYASDGTKYNKNVSAFPEVDGSLDWCGGFEIDYFNRKDGAK